MSGLGVVPDLHGLTALGQLLGGGMGCALRLSRASGLMLGLRREGVGAVFLAGHAVGFDLGHRAGGVIDL